MGREGGCLSVHPLSWQQRSLIIPAMLGICGVLVSAGVVSCRAIQQRHVLRPTPSKSTRSNWRGRSDQAVYTTLLALVCTSQTQLMDSWRAPYHSQVGPD